MVQEYLDEIREVITNKNINIGSDFTYFINTNENWYWCKSNDITNIQTSWMIRPSSELFKFYESENISIYVEYDKFLRDENVVIDSGRSIFSILQSNEKFEFMIYCENENVHRYLENRFKYCNGFQYYVSHHPHFNRAINCYCTVAYLDRFYFTVYCVQNGYSLVRFSIKRDGSGFISKQDARKLSRNFQADDFVEVKYSQKYHADLANYKIDIDDATTKVNKRFYKRFKKYL